MVLKFSFYFHTVLWAFDKQKFLMLTLLDVRRHARCLSLLLEKMCLSWTSVWGTRSFGGRRKCAWTTVLREKDLTLVPKGKLSRRGNLLRDLFHSFYRIFTKYLRLLSGTLRMRFIALVSITNCAQTQEHMVLKYLPIESSLSRTCKSDSPRSARKESMIRSNKVLRCA